MNLRDRWRAARGTGSGERWPEGRAGAAGSLAALPVPARVYVGAVCAAAAVVLVRALANTGPLPSGALSALILLSLTASIVKLEIPVSGNVSTLTACHVIDLMTLIMYGTSAAVVVSAWGGWTQCTFRSRLRNPVHQTAFSVAGLALTMWCAGAVFGWMGGQPDGASSSPRWEPVGAAAAVSFAVNSALVAGAVSLATPQRFFATWNSFLSSWPSYIIGAVLALAIVTGIQHKSYWLAPLVATALALFHRDHKTMVDRVHDSMTDPLTGLYNQRFVIAHAERELAQARRSRGRVALAVLDLDHFKQINDQHGHAAGDAALRRVARVLTAGVRIGDVCARYGGDEFVIVMTNCDEVEGLRRVHELQKAVAATATDGQSAFGATSISGGVAAFPDDGVGFEELFATADSRMYQRKRAATSVSSPGF